MLLFVIACIAVAVNAAPTLKWKYTTGGVVRSSPAVVNGTMTVCH